MRAFSTLAFVALVLPATSALAQVELKNDGFQSGQAAGFQGGFSSFDTNADGTPDGEIGASRFVAASGGLQLLKVQLLFGGATATRDVTLKVWDDSANSDTPGVELHSSDFTMTGSNTQIQELVLPVQVIVTQQFRVGILFHTGGLPSIARDDDGNINASRNFILAEGLGWTKSQTLGLTGDWIIRAFVNGTGPQPDAGVTPDAGPNVTPDAPLGAMCSGNAQCPEGQFCDLAQGACTFECRTDDDCGGGNCNSLGQCVGGGTSSSGCCRADGGGGSTGAVVGLGLLLVWRRRRR